MDEVDIDKSHTLDFYEYLLVVDKITKKSGMFQVHFQYFKIHIVEAEITVEDFISLFPLAV